MFLTSSSQLRNAVLMSPEIRRYLCEATHCMIKASDAADNVGLSRETCFCLSTRLPCQDPPRAHDSLLVNKLFLDQIKHSVIKPRLKLQLLCLSEKLPVTLCHFLSLTSTRFRRAELTANTSTTELPSSSTSTSVITSINVAFRSSSSGSGGRSDSGT